MTREQAKARWLNGVPEDKQAALIPPGWFEQWADATWATDPVGAKQNPPVVRAPNGTVAGHPEFWTSGKTMYDPAKITVPTLIAIGEWDKRHAAVYGAGDLPAAGQFAGQAPRHAGRRHASHDAGEEPRWRCSAPCRRSSTRAASRLARMNSHDHAAPFSRGRRSLSRGNVRRRPRAQRPLQFPPVQAVTARHGMVVAQESRAARIGAEVLKRGGNAVDAAVAVGFAMAVTYPRAGNIGGGGFMVIHLARKRQPHRDIAIDYRETAPAATTRDTFLNAQGEADPAKSREHGLAIGVPGTVAGLTLALQKYGSGKFKLAQLIAPAIDLARNGYKVGDEFEDTGRSSIARMARWPSTAKLFLQPDGSLIARGTLLVQSDLANTLDAISKARPARVLRRAGRRQNFRRGARRRRADDRRRPEEL